MNEKRVAIIGSGPAGLMAAFVLAKVGVSVIVFEKKNGPAAKLLVAGRSGLNISYNAKEKPLWEYYDGPKDHFKAILENFSVNQWIRFIESLGIKTFEGTSRRYFIKSMKSAPLIKKWIKRLQKEGVKFSYGMEFTDFEASPAGIEIQFNQDKTLNFDAVCLCLGGGSWPIKDEVISWPQIFKDKKIPFQDWSASNVGYEVSWSKEFLKEAEGLPLKNITLTSSQGVVSGEVVVTRYGLEGTPIYHLKKTETIYFDLQPSLSIQKIKTRLTSSKENISPLRRAKKFLKLSPAALALLFHHSPKESGQDIDSFCQLIKHFPIQLTMKRGLKEAISSQGGIDWKALNKDLMLKDYPGIFIAGEMLDWDAPTGGFLIQGCVSQGYHIGNAVLSYLSNQNKLES